MAFVYDIFRIRRKTVRTPNIFTHIEDLLYWIIVALIMFGVVYISNEGEIRGYIFIGTLLGVILYILLLSRAVMKSSLFMLNLLGRAIKTIVRIVMFPLKILWKILLIPGRPLAAAIVRLFKKIGNGIGNILSKAAAWKKAFKKNRSKRKKQKSSDKASAKSSAKASAISSARPYVKLSDSNEVNRIAAVQKTDKDYGIRKNRKAFFSKKAIKTSGSKRINNKKESAK